MSTMRSGLTVGNRFALTAGVQGILSLLVVAGSILGFGAVNDDVHALATQSVPGSLQALSIKASVYALRGDFLCAVAETNASQIPERERSVRDDSAQLSAALNAYAQTIANDTDRADFEKLKPEVAAIESVERIAFISSHPKDLNEKLAIACAAIPKMNPRFHLALQSGSNPVLRRMNRKYTIEEFLERIAVFRSHNPAWAFTTDLIVGFPGETEEDFQRTHGRPDLARVIRADLRILHADEPDETVARDRGRDLLPMRRRGAAPR